MSAAAILQGRLRTVLIAVICTCSVGLAGVVAWSTLRGSFRRSGPAAAAHAEANTTTARNRAAAEFEYPASSGALPDSITIRYDERHDRTRMVLQLTDLEAIAANAGLAKAITLVLTSEFAGRVRDPSHGELSVVAAVSARTAREGLLAMGSRAPVLTAGTTSLEARLLRKAESGYEDKKQGTSHVETAKFKIDTSQLITIATAPSLSLQLGGLTARLSSSQHAAVREFVARMNPKGSP